MLLHEEEGEEDFEHALAILHVVEVAVEFYYALCIHVQTLSVLQNWCSRYITLHFAFEFPMMAYFGLFLSKFLNIFFDFFTEQYFLQAN